MKEIDEISKLMLALIEEVKQDGDNLIFNDKAKLIVKEIADFARTTHIYQREKEFSEQFWEENKDAR